ncbi:MAG: hypothetical protein M5R42_14820 [Rhodocyclaceae bacterium]|nr:hypothetical protein [Rhodocyclaceae bacterium]
MRIAMTVGAPGMGEGRLLTVTEERLNGGDGVEVETVERVGAIHADLTIGVNVSSARALQANAGVSSPGFSCTVRGFIVSPEDTARAGAQTRLSSPIAMARTLPSRPRGVKVIDLFGHTADEVRARWPATYQWVLERVKPERDHNN